MKRTAINKKVKDKIGGLKGLVTFTTFRVNGEEAESAERLLGEAQGIPWEEFDRLISKLDVSRETTFNNMIVDVGRAVFARRLINDLTYSGVVNWGAVGTGSTAVAAGDTVLDTELKRKGVSTRTRSGSTVTLRFFYTKADFADTVEEFGTFIDGTSAADSGQMFNRVLTGGWVKSALEALTVTVQFDLNAQP